jgi:hypothetical protein
MALIPRYRLAVDRWIAIEPNDIGIEREITRVPGIEVNLIKKQADF